MSKRVLLEKEFSKGQLKTKKEYFIFFQKQCLTKLSKEENKINEEKLIFLSGKK